MADQLMTRQATREGLPAMTDWIVPLATFEAQLAGSERPSWQGLTHGTMRFYLFAPGDRDVATLQGLVETNHAQDEIYIVLRGTCAFSKDGDAREIRTGDVLFVEAQATHRFEAYSPDFAAWVIFWGPPGGEGQA